MSDIHESTLAVYKRKIFSDIAQTEDSSKASVIFDISIITLIIINVVLVVADTFGKHITPVFHAIEVFSVVVFTIEYALRFWTADLLRPGKNAVLARLRYMFSFMALIDLLSILPFYLPFLLSTNLIVLRSLRVLRLLRLFKLTRYSNVTTTMGAVFKKKASQIISSVSVILVLMIITSVLMYNVEHAAQPEKFSNAFDSLWWTICTITTVGYGDIYPVTLLGKVFSGIIAFLSIGLIAIPTSIISSGFIESVDQMKEEKAAKEREQNKKCFCPYCGGKLD
jgi:voltage-gated potassium channel